MSARRVYVAPPGLDGPVVTFGPREARHLVAVLRLAPGDRVVAFDGRREADVVLETIAPAVTGRLVGAPRRMARPIGLTLLQGVARGPKMDLIVRMATEIGVEAVVPVLTARARPHPGDRRIERWTRIAREAARQCGRADVPQVATPVALHEALRALPPVDLFVVPWEAATEPLGAAAGAPFRTAAVLIGPEGGLTGEEVAAAQAAGARPVSLGPLILRTETAGVAALAMLLYEGLLRPGRGA